MKSSMYRCTLSDGALPGFMPLASCLASLYRYLIREDRLEGFGRPKPNLPSEREGHRSLGFPTRGGLPLITEVPRGLMSLLGTPSSPFLISVRTPRVAIL